MTDAFDESLAVVGGPARGPHLQNLWEAARRNGRYDRYFSQSGQDRFLDARVFGGARNGVFVEVGAYDGLVHSNTAFLEIHRGWDGLLIEASPGLAAAARNNRRAPCIERAVGAKSEDMDYLVVLAGHTAMSGILDSYNPALLDRVRAHPAHRERILRLAVRPLGEILDEAGIPAVDYLSLDVEGAELRVLESFPFGRIPVRVWSIENNAGSPRIARLMAGHGYELMDTIGMDEIYVPAQAPTFDP
ncbi:MAG: methyltransferase [Alphaproteobacteria bacterium]|jgi:FkbM family methyltransferase|nr:methyltransferase [Alphaproteobacteria bacterium]